MVDESLRDYLEYCFTDEKPRKNSHTSLNIDIVVLAVIPVRVVIHDKADRVQYDQGKDKVFELFVLCDSYNDSTEFG